jgi:hypothetical protein
MDQPQAQLAGGCEPHSALPSGLPSGSGTAVYQQFPPSGPMRTAWFVTFDHAVHRGLFLTSDAERVCLNARTYSDRVGHLVV